MKSSLNILSAAALAVLLPACERTKQFLDIPRQGTLHGTITDSLTSRPVAGVELFATYVLPNSSSGEVKTISFETDKDGRYQLRDIWDEVYIEVTKAGFRPVSFTQEIRDHASKRRFDITLEGLPRVEQYHFSKTDLSLSAADTTKLTLEIRDLYNDNPGGSYGATLFFYELSSDLTVGVVELTDQFASHSYFGKVASIPASLFPKTGAYGLFFEITDPDGNFVELGIAEDLDTINVH